MKAASLIETLAFRIREHELAQAKSLVSQLKNQRRSKTGTSSPPLTPQEIIQRQISASNLSAALDIKCGRPDKAATTFTRLLQKHRELVNDPIFLANLGVVFSLLKDESRARCVLALVPQQDTVFEEQAQVWLDRHLRHFSREEEVERQHDASPEKKTTKPESTTTFRDREAELIVWLKREIAESVAVLERGNSSSTSKDDFDGTIRRLQLAIKRCDDDVEMAQQSKAVLRLRKKIEHLVCHSVCLLNAR